MRALAIVSMAAVAACASSGVSSSRPSTETVRVMGVGGGQLEMRSSSAGLSTTIGAPIAQVWRVLPAAYDSVGVGVTMIDQKEHLLANEGLKTRQRLGKAALSRYINCGATQIGPNADSYDVYATLKTKLDDNGDSTTKITTLFESAARPVQFSGDYSRCTTTGALEARIAEIIKLRVMK